MPDKCADQYGVIGNPIGPTKSPFIHGAFARTTAQAMANGTAATVCGYANLVDQTFDIVINATSASLRGVRPDTAAVIAQLAIPVA